MPIFRFDETRAQLRPMRHQRECQRNVTRALDPDRPTLLHIATGGGKTFVANNVVVAELARHEGYVLWITKDWELLGHAAADIAARHKKLGGRLARLGGDRRVGDIHELPPVRQIHDVAVVYTTLQTFRQRVRKLPRSVKPVLVVWDECHWGYASKTGRILRSWVKRRRIPMIGLTATPRYREDFHHACSHTFRELVEAEVLADYRLQPRVTGVAWSPQRNFDGSDVAASSLDQLARSRKRNRQIIEEYRNNASKYGKTIVFACNVRHADVLARLFGEAGVAARPVHSALPAVENQRTLRDFAKAGRKVDVVINVAMLTHGIDIPTIRTVFLCRPTFSDVLFSQMVGRGARRLPDKTTFNLVEFTDNADRFLPDVLTTRTFFGRSGQGGGGSRTWKHRFDPRGMPAWTGADVPEALRDLWYLEGQTFGVEFEFTSDVDPEMIDLETWYRKAGALRDCLRRRLGDGRVRGKVTMEYGTKGYERWKVEWDASVGWEVVSPVLQGESGLRELAEVCEALTDDIDEIGLQINYRTGTHIHLGWSREAKHVVGALQVTHLLEPILRTLVPPSRFAAFESNTDSYDITNHNDYCMPVASVYDVLGMDESTTVDNLKRMADGERCTTLNPTPLWDRNPPHVEVRLFGGTTEARKLLPWISLWMRILWAVKAGVSHPAEYDLKDPPANFPTLDILDALSVVPLPEENEAFVDRLKERQREVFALWREHEELRAWTNARGRRPFTRRMRNIADTLVQRCLPNPTGRFLDLDDGGRLCALWCVLLGEGRLPRNVRSTVELCAERLREDGWVVYDRLDQRGAIYHAVSDTLELATMDGSNGWLEIPRGGYVRAFVRVEGGPPSQAAMAIDEVDWHDCVLRALARFAATNADGLMSRVDRSDVPRLAFDVAREYYGIQYENFVVRLEQKIDVAIDDAIGAGLLRREGDQLIVLFEYLGP